MFFENYWKRLIAEKRDKKERKKKKEKKINEKDQFKTNKQTTQGGKKRPSSRESVIVIVWLVHRLSLQVQDSSILLWK